MGPDAPVRRLVSIIRRERIDLVQTHLAGADVQGGLAAWLTGRPSVSVLHSVAADRATLRTGLVVLADFATRHLADADRRGQRGSQSEPRDRARRCSGPASQSCRTCRSGPICLATVSTGRRSGASWRSLTHLMISVASRLERPKDHETFLRSLPAVVEAHPRLRVLILGDGPLRGHLVSLCTDLGLDGNVVFAGARFDAVEIIGASDVFCHPTLYEGFGLALAEAMALAVPVVATGVSGVLELIDDGRTGRLVPPQDPVALARALERASCRPGAPAPPRPRGAELDPLAARPDAWVRAVEQVYVEAVAQRRARRRGFSRQAS